MPWQHPTLRLTPEESDRLAREIRERTERRSTYCCSVCGQLIEAGRMECTDRCEGSEVIFLRS